MTQSVRFNSGLPHHGRVYFQPLFYLSENYRQVLNKSVGACKTDESRIDTNIVINNGTIKLETRNYIGTNGDTRIFYTLNQSSNEVAFTYKGVEFILNMEDRKDLPERLFSEHRDDVIIYSSYEILFEKKNLETFEDFTTASIAYYDKYYNNDKDDANKISIYLTSQEGFYFNFLGKRHKRDMDSIYLPKKQKDDILADLTKFLKPETRARYLKLGINHKRVYLLEGVPGTGKTSLITAIASKFNFNIAIVSFVPKMTDIDLLRALRTINDTQENDNDEHKPKQSILVFEDIDCIFKERKSHDENKNGITFSGLLNALDGITSNENLVCFITTNYKNNLDSALLRPGRVDYIMRFDHSTKEQIQDMFKDFTDSDASAASQFYSACCELRIKMTTALLQQYLMKYMDNPAGAIDNVEEMKKMFEKSKVDKEADETNLYH